MEVDVRKSGNQTVFATKQVSFIIENELLEPNIKPEIKKIVEALSEISIKSYPITIHDLLDDISSSISVFDAELPLKSLSREDLEKMNLISKKNKRK